LTFIDAAAQNLPDNWLLSSGLFKPTNFDAVDTFPSPAPQTQTGSMLGSFFESNPNGTWSLFVVDDNGNNAGNIAGGWNLIIKTSTNACLPTVSPSTQSFTASGGNGSFQIGTVVGYGWMVSTTNPFITFDSPTNGLGNTTVNFSVAAKFQRRNSILTATAEAIFRFIAAEFGFYGKARAVLLQLHSDLQPTKSLRQILMATAKQTSPSFAPELGICLVQRKAWQLHNSVWQMTNLCECIRAIEGTRTL
jgi:hypothetical protein